jgi:hypothetical protein
MQDICKIAKIYARYRKIAKFVCNASKNIGEDRKKNMGGRAAANLKKWWEIR